MFSLGQLPIGCFCRHASLPARFFEKFNARGLVRKRFRELEKVDFVFHLHKEYTQKWVRQMINCLNFSA